jgi:hypothetical protein
MRRALFVCLLAAALQACSTPHTSFPAPRELEDLKAGNASALIVNVSGEMGCDETVLGIHRKGSDKNVVFWTLREVGYRTSGPAIQVVEPGTYRIAGAACLKEGYYPSQMSTIPLWFGDVELKPGEVVYIGTLDIQILDYKTEMSKGAKVFNAIFFTGRDSNEFKYLSYEMHDENAEVLERLRVSYPDIAAKLIVKLPPIYLTTDKFAAALQAAYAPNADGSLPTTDQAQTRLPLELKKLGEEALRARLRDNAAAAGPQTGKN